jgi:hypothetical protein
MLLCKRGDEDMFGRKKEPDTWSSEDIHMKELLDNLCEHRQVMITYCRKIILCKGSAEMLPDGPDKNIELQEIETYQKRILNLVSAYDDDLRQYKQINNSCLVHYTGKTQQMTSHEALHMAWEIAYRKVLGI